MNSLLSPEDKATILNGKFDDQMLLLIEHWYDDSPDWIIAAHKYFRAGGKEQ